MKHRTQEELEAGLDTIRQAPKDVGRLEWLICRPEVGERRVLSEAQLDTAEGLIGDNWKTRGSSSTPDGSANPEMQLNIMGARAIGLLTEFQDEWSLAGDQLYVDLDLSHENLPPGTRLSVGDAVLVVTAPPHTGCKKFMARFGLDALKWVSDPVGRQLNLRGINAKVLQSGTIRVGDTVSRL